MPRVLILLAAALAVADLVAYARYPWGYLSSVGYIGHTEPMVAQLAWLLLKGHALYGNVLDDGYLINIYGPVLYLVEAASLLVFGAGTFASKLPGTLAVVVSLGAFGIDAVRRHGWGPGLVGVAAFAGFLLHFLPASFWGQSDPLILVVVTVASVAAGWRSDRRATFAIGVGAGLLVNLKVYSPVFLVPAMVELVLMAGTRREGVIRLVLAGVVGAVVALLPYLLPSVSLFAYLDGVKAITAVRGRDLGDILPVVQNSGYFLLPLVVALLGIPLARSRPEGPELRLAIMLLATNIVVLIPASMPGAGGNHLLPLIPLSCELVCRLAGRYGGVRPRLAWLVMVVPVVLSMTSLPIQKRYRANTEHLPPPAVAAELASLMERHRGEPMAMGWGTDFSTYHRTYLYPLLAFAGNPPMQHAVTLMELQASEIKGYADSLERDLAECRIRQVVIPAGDEPFLMKNYYPRPEHWLAPQPVRDAFHRRFTKSESLEYFDLWTCMR